MTSGADTPTHWKEYEAYVRETNRKRNDSYIAHEKALQDEYDALPWYKKLVAQDPSTDWARYIPIMPRDMEITITGYYHWDTHIRCVCPKGMKHHALSCPRNS